MREEYEICEENHIFARSLEIVKKLAFSQKAYFLQKRNFGIVQNIRILPIPRGTRDTLRTRETRKLPVPVLLLEQTRKLLVLEQILVLLALGSTPERGAQC